jgi:hypothetical protein
VCISGGVSALGLSLTISVNDTKKDTDKLIINNMKPAATQPIPEPAPSSLLTPIAKVAYKKLQVIHAELASSVLFIVPAFIRLYVYVMKGGVVQRAFVSNIRGPIYLR